MKKVRHRVSMTDLRRIHQTGVYTGISPVGPAQSAEVRPESSLQPIAEGFSGKYDSNVADPCNGVTHSANSL